MPVWTEPKGWFTQPQITRDVCANLCDLPYKCVLKN